MHEFDGVIGIDLGTTFSCVAVFLHHKVEVVPNDQGNRTTPSRIAFQNRQMLVGEPAFNLSVRGSSNVMYDAKRLIGRTLDEKVIQEDQKNWPFTVKESSTKKNRLVLSVDPYPGEEPAIELEPEAVSAHVLHYLKECAQRHLGKKVRRAVITVPAYFNDAQRQATKDAGRIAGLEVLRIINEPTAAALCYGFGTASLSGTSATMEPVKNVVVFDFGGGTFDVSVISIDNGAFEVRSTAGDTHLGGQDIDQNVLAFFLEDIRKRHKVDFSTNLKMVAKLRAVAEKVKRALSHTTHEEVSVDGILPQGDDYITTISRAKFDELNLPVYKRCLDVVKRALTDSKLKVSEIHDVIMVGGSSRIPKVREMVSQFFNKPTLCTSVNPDEAIAIGAAIQGSILSADPAQKSDETAGVVLMDVVSLSIGVDVDEGKFDVLIPRNTTIPYSTSKEFTTNVTNQKEIEIEVYEGERPLTKHNHKLGSFLLDGIRKARKGVPNIVVSLSLDANGILTVTAEERIGGASASKVTLVVQNQDRLSCADVDRMIDEAKAMHDADALQVAVQERLRTLHDAFEYLEGLLEKLPESKKSHPKVVKRVSFLETAHLWAEQKAPRMTNLEELDAKLAKLQRLMDKAAKTVKKVLEKVSKKSRKRRRDDDDDEDDGAQEGDDGADGGERSDDDDEDGAGGSDDSDEDDDDE